MMLPLVLACGNADEMTASDTASYVVEEEGSLGSDPGVAYRLGGRNDCTREAGRDAVIRKIASSPNVAVAKMRVVEECSSLGGNHVLGATTDVFRGDAANSLHAGGHGCPTWTMGTSRPYVEFVAYAVIGYHRAPTSQLDGGGAWCLPDESDGTIEGMVFFDAEQKARAFARVIAH